MATFRLISKPLQTALCTAFICAAFTSCSNSEADTLSATEDAKVPLSISAAIQSGTEARKAGYDATAFATGDEIGLYILSTDMESAYSSDYTCYNVHATYNGSSWTFGNDVYLYEDNAYVIAYYPYSESFGNSFPSSDNPITIDITPDGDEQADVLTSACVTVNRESPTADLTFGHALSRLTVNVVLSGQIETAELSAISISGDNLPDSTMLSISGDAFSLIDVEEYTKPMTIDCDATLTTESASSVDFLISPYSSTTLEASFVIDGETYSIDLTNTNGWQSGYRYTYDITANMQTILLEVTSSSAINAWDDKGTVSEIDIEYQDTTADSGTYEAVDLGLSVKWATCNIGAESPEDYGNYYAWGETETKDEYYSSNSVTYGVSMEDFSGDAEYDAAAANWGGSWRIPTCDEMKELLNDCTYEWTTLNDVYGYLFTGNNGNSIFFPAAGYRSGSSLEDDGSNGHYWSSTPYTEDTSDTSYAHILYFSNDYYGVHYLDFRSWGHTVRPVTE